MGAARAYAPPWWLALVVSYTHRAALGTSMCRRVGQNRLIDVKHLTCLRDVWMEPMLEGETAILVRWHREMPSPRGCDLDLTPMRVHADTHETRNPYTRTQYSALYRR